MKIGKKLKSIFGFGERETDAKTKEYAARTETLEELAHKEIVGGCCSRHSARDFYDKYTSASPETALEVYFAARKPMHSYCERTRSSSTGNNIRIVKHALHSGYSLLTKVEKSERPALIKKLSDILYDLGRDAESLDSEIGSVPKLMKIATGFSKDGDYMSAAMLLTSVKDITREKDSDLTRVVDGLVDRYRPKVIEEITKEKIPIEEKKKKLSEVIYSLTTEKKREDLLNRLSRIDASYKTLEEKFTRDIERSYGRAMYPIAEEIKKYEEKAKKEIAETMATSEKSTAEYKSRISRLSSFGSSDSSDIDEERKKLVETLRGESAALEKKYAAEISEIESKETRDLAKPREEMEHLAKERDTTIEKIKDRTLTREEYKKLSGRLRKESRGKK